MYESDTSSFGATSFFGLGAILGYFGLRFEWKHVFWKGNWSTKCMKVTWAHLEQLHFGPNYHLAVTGLSL